MTTDTTARVSGTIKGRPTFPILGGGARIDLQLVVDHSAQAQRNHYQTVERLAQRGGLCWVELYAVLHDKPFQKMDPNEAIAACRGIEARYLAAIQPDPQPVATRSCTELVAQLSAALEDAINAPKGVVPKSADPFYDGFQGRVRMPHPNIGNPITPDPEPQPVAWFTEDHLTDKSATTWDRTVADRWAAKGWPVTPLYATPSSAGMVSVEAAAQVLLTAFERAQIDMGIIRIFQNGQHVTALRALAGERG